MKYDCFQIYYVLWALFSFYKIRSSHWLMFSKKRSSAKQWPARYLFYICGRESWNIPSAEIMFSNLTGFWNSIDILNASGYNSEGATKSYSSKIAVLHCSGWLSGKNYKKINVKRFSIRKAKGLQPCSFTKNWAPSKVSLKNF